jgi:hypothetical protein
MIALAVIWPRDHPADLDRGRAARRPHPNPCPVNTPLRLVSQLTTVRPLVVRWEMPVAPGPGARPLVFPPSGITTALMANLAVRPNLRPDGKRSRRLIC